MSADVSTPHHVMHICVTCSKNHWHEIGVAVEGWVHPAVRWPNPISEDWSDEYLGCTLPTDLPTRAMREFHLHPEAAIRQGFVSMDNAA